MVIARTNLATVSSVDVHIGEDAGPATFRIEVRGESGRASVAPYPLAAYYKLRQREDCQTLMTHLARNRARAVVDALAALGVPRSRLRTGALRPGSGELRTQLRARPLEGLRAIGFEPAVAACFRFVRGEAVRLCLLVCGPLLRFAVRLCRTPSWEAVILCRGVPSFG